MAHVVAILMAAFLAVFVPDQGEAQSIRTGDGSPVIFSAKEASRDYERKVVELKGNVQVIYNGQHISCDHAVIDLANQEVTAIGNLIISSPTAYIEGERATLSYRDNTGTIYNGFVKSGQVIFEGRIVRKTGPEQYVAESAYYTACTTCPSAWSFSGTRIKAEMGGYAYIRNSVLEVGGVPVFWLPYLIVPLKSERQTGLLMPVFDYAGEGGAAIGIPFFWAISRSQDALFTLKFYANRGQKGLVNYRYLLSETSGGELNSGIIRDRFFIHDETARGNPVGNKLDRWFLTYDHTYDLPYQFTQRTKLNLVSDLRYSRDFPDEISGQGDPALENRVSLTRNTESTHSSVDTSYYVNQLKANPLSPNQDAVHRFPELRFDLAERNIGSSNLLFRFNSDYVNFAREDFAYDDIYTSSASTKASFPKNVDLSRKNKPGGGVFNPGTDVIRAGQRLDLNPEASYPFHIGPLLDVLPSVEYRHTQYSFNVAAPPGSDFNTAPLRQYVRTSVAARTQFSRIFSLSEDSPLASPSVPTAATVLPAPVPWSDFESQGPAAKNISPPAPPPPTTPDRYKHEFQPEIVYAGVPWVQQSDSPFFGQNSLVAPSLADQPVSDADFYLGRGIQFDYYDRIANRNTLTFVLGNRLIRKSYIENSSDYRQIASIKVAQSYDFDEERKTSGPKFPWSDISTLMDIRLNNFETNTLVRYFPYHGVVNTSARVKLNSDRGAFVQTSLTQTHLITTKTSEAPANITENVGFDAGFETRYFGFSGSVALLPVSWEKMRFDTKSWAMILNIRPPGDCWGIRTYLRQDIGASISYRFEFNYMFGGGNS
jgi:LPS-assembly protein